MNLRHLKIFQDVAEAGSIRAAARGSKLTQPAMSYAIRELEQQVGATLFVRSITGVAPTPIGQALLRRARLLFNEVRRAEDEIAQLREGASGTLRVAFSSFALARILPKALLAFRASWPGVTLELQELSGPGVPGLWEQGHFDFAIASELATQADDGLDREALLEFPLSVLCAEGHPLARARSFARLKDALWAVPPYGAELVRSEFAAAGIPAPRDMVICHSWQLGITLLREAGALTIAAATIMDSASTIQGLTALSLGRKLPNVRMSLLMRDRNGLTPAAKAFVEDLKKVAGGLPVLRPHRGSRTAPTA